MTNLKNTSESAMAQRHEKSCLWYGVHAVKKNCSWKTWDCICKQAIPNCFLVWHLEN